MGVWSRLLGRDDASEPVTEAIPARAEAARVLPTRAGYEYGVGPEGIDELNARRGAGASGTDDRATHLQALYDAFMACPWSAASVNVIARTITAGGLRPEYDADDAEAEADIPAWPAQLQALMTMLAYCNPRETIRQIVRGMITDLLVFGECYVELVWLLGQPVAMYSLDAPSMYPVADEHGEVTGYVQSTEYGQRATFGPRDVIWITLDSPRSGLSGVPPTEQAMLPLTIWLFVSATLKERYRKGDPHDIAVDLPASLSENDVRKWASGHMQRNVGIKNIGYPVTTKGGGSVTELSERKLELALKLRDQTRDEIVATYGVPPRKVGISEPGMLGGAGAETGQDKTFRVNTCEPLGELVLGALNFTLLRAFGVPAPWQLGFGEVDLRDDQVIEGIRDQRLRSGAWTLNRYRADIGEPPVDVPAADEPLFTDRMATVLWRDLDALSSHTANPPSPPPAPGAEPGAEPGQDDPNATAGKAAKAKERAAQVALLAEAVRHYRRNTTDAHRAATRELAAAAAGAGGLP